MARAEDTTGEPTVARTFLQTFERLSGERARPLSREGAHRGTGEDRRWIPRIDHEVLCDPRRREPSGSIVAEGDDHYDGYTLDPGDDPPPAGG